MSQRRSYIDYQERGKQFSVGDVVVPVGAQYTEAGKVVAVYPAIGAVDVEFPELNKRMVVEELIRIVNFHPTPPDTNNSPVDDAPGGEEGDEDAISQGPEDSRRREAVYWASRDRQYRATQDERDTGVYYCPKCNGVPLRKTVYKRRRGQSEHLLGCPSCLWLVRESDLDGCHPMNPRRKRRNVTDEPIVIEEVKSRLARLHRLYERWEREPERMLSREIDSCRRNKPELFQKLLRAAKRDS